MRFLRVTAIIIASLLLTLFVWGKIYQSVQPKEVGAAPLADTLHIHNDIQFLTDSCRYRVYNNEAMLNKAAGYIKQQLLQATPDVSEQNFVFQTKTFTNIIASIGPKDKPVIVIGAHYDVCEAQDGADDNASGIAGMLELAGLLKNSHLNYRIEFVAYTLEEPPFFRSEYMGSYIHAKSLKDKNENVKGMICLETIGYYSDKAGSQSYPAFFLKWFYGNRGNFITVVNRFNGGEFSKQFTTLMKKNPVLPTRSFGGPSWIPGVDFSDHLNYWKFGYSAVMISNTAFYRNHRYHTADDRFNTLQISKIGLVVDEVYRALLQLK